ncbi:MAG: EamA family transporter [Elusimicrobiota bacterium]
MTSSGVPLWFVLAAACGVCNALEGAWVKHLSGRGFKPEFFAWCAASFTLPILWFSVSVEGWPAIQPAFYFPFAMAVLGNTVGLICFFRALSYGQLSLVYPLLALTPVWMLLSTEFITGEFPGRLGLWGILLSTAGCYALGLDRTGPLSPFRNLWGIPGSRWALITSVIWSFTANFDKAAVEASSAMFHPAAAGTALAVTLFAAAPRSCVDGLKRCAKWDDLWRVLVLTALVGVLVLTQFAAVDRAQATYVTAVKRGGLVVGVLLGWLLYKEPYGLRRLALSCVVLAGILCLVWA